MQVCCQRMLYSNFSQDRLSALLPALKSLFPLTMTVLVNRFLFLNDLTLICVSGCYYVGAQHKGKAWADRKCGYFLPFTACDNTAIMSFGKMFLFPKCTAAQGRIREMCPHRYIITIPSFSVSKTLQSMTYTAVLLMATRGWLWIKQKQKTHKS